MILFTTEAQRTRRENESSTDFADFDLGTDGSSGRKNRLGKTAAHTTLAIAHLQPKSV